MKVRHGVLVCVDSDIKGSGIDGSDIEGSGIEIKMKGNKILLISRNNLVLCG